MYKITYVHKDSNTELPLFTPGDEDYCVTDVKVDLSMGMAGEMDLSIPVSNPARYDIECLTDEVILYRNDKELWRGRPVTVQQDFIKTGDLVCEGILAYLYDTYFEPFEFQGSPEDLFKWFIENHNRHVEARKQFKIGNITIKDDNDYINRSSINYERTLTAMTDKLINDSLGGYFRVRVENDGRYIDYLETYATQATQSVEYGQNILDIATEVEYTDLATVILPLGAKLEDEDGNKTDDYTTIESVNNGSIYYEDPGAVEEYGWICVCIEWEDVTLPSNLLNKAINYLKQVTNAVQSFTVKAIDLSLMDDSYDAINLGDYVLVRSIEHGINQYVELTSMTLYPLSPEDDTLQFGGDTATLTDAQRNSDRSVQSALGELSMRVTNLTANVINAVYANIEEIVAGTITVDVIRAAVAELGYVTIDYLYANFIDAATLEADYLKADSAVITDLTAWAANIYTLLSGQAGVGELQTIYLTTANAVIDEAVIIDALVDNAIIGTLLAGTIYTDYIQIMDNDDQNLYIKGSVIQFRDSDGVVRMQMGLDEAGYWNYYILDENGNTIFDALGLTEAGLVGNGAIIRNDAVADDANISGYKLDIETVTECINEYGGIEVDATKITIDGDGLDVWINTILQSISDESELISTLQTELTVVQGYIDAKIWESDIESAINGVNTTISDYYTEISIELGNIDALISQMQTTESDDYLELISQISDINISLSGLSSTVANVEQSISDVDSSLSARITNVEQTADGLSSSVIQIESTVADVQDAVTTVETNLSSRIDQLAGSISLEVSGGLGSNASIILTVDGSEYKETIDLARIRQAFADDESAVIIEGGIVAFASNTFTVDSTYLTITEDGSLYASNATVTGTFTAIDEPYKAELTAGHLSFCYDDIETLYLVSSYWTKTPDDHGGTIVCSTYSYFLALGYTYGSGSLYTTYVVNSGLNPYGYTERNIFFEDTRFDDAVYCATRLEVNSRLEVGGYAYIDGPARFYDDVSIFGDVSIGRVSAVSGVTIEGSLTVQNSSVSQLGEITATGSIYTDSNVYVDGHVVINGRTIGTFSDTGDIYIRDTNSVNWELYCINAYPYYLGTASANTTYYVTITWGGSFPGSAYYFSNIDCSNNTYSITSRVYSVDLHENCRVVIPNTNSVDINFIHVLVLGLSTQGG